MSWNFSTEPEFEKKLEWMREFVREEIIPLEVADLSPEAFEIHTDKLKDQVREQGLWAAHLEPELGGGGFGQLKLGLMHEILGQSVFAPPIFGNNAPDSGNAELLAIGGNDYQKEQWMYPLLAGELRSCFSMTEPGAGADPNPGKQPGDRCGRGGIPVRKGHRQQKPGPGLPADGLRHDLGPGQRDPGLLFQGLLHHRHLPGSGKNRPHFCPPGHPSRHRAAVLPPRPARRRPPAQKLPAGL